MATNKNVEETPEEPETQEAPPEEAPPTPPGEDVAPEQPQGYELPPTLKEAGLTGVVGLTSGQYTLPSGSSFALTPGQAYAVSSEDASALVEMGVASPLEDVQPPS